MRQTLKHLAEELNISAMTVSRALRGDRGVSEETRARVQEYARRVNYQPDLVARSLVAKRSHVLGIIIPDLRDFFWLDTVVGVERAARSAGYHVLLTHSDGSPELERSEIWTLMSRRVDALLIASCDPEGNVPALRDVETRGVPVLRFDRGAEEETLSGAFTDDLGGARQAVQHFLRLSYRRIAHLTGDLRFSTARARLRGYEETIREAGRTPIVVEGGFEEDSGYQAMRKLIDSHIVDAVFVANDTAAIGALRAAQERGRRVPEDIALIGYGDIHCAEHVRIPLTTISQPRQALGAALAELALQRIHNKGEANARVVLPTQLIVRRSCGAYLRAGKGPGALIS